MSWHPGVHCKDVPLNLVNKEWENVRGDLTPDEAQNWLVHYLSCNPNAAAELLIGPKAGRLYPIQDILIRTWFQRKNNLLIAGRGFSKSYTTAIFVVLYCLFNPGAKIGIFSASFRQAKLMFKTIEDFIDSPEAGFLQQCVNKDKILHNTDGHEMKIGSSSVKALPLTSKTRGMRFSLVIIDEYLSVPEKIVQEIIKPMLVVPKGGGAAQEKIKAGEDILIAQGKMQEWQRTKFLENKILMLSSASYKFDTLYKDTYLDFLACIHKQEIKDVDHSLFRLSYKCAPKDKMDLKLIEAARRTYSTHQFEREYGAIFTDDSGGFFNSQAVARCQVPEGEEPRIKLKGDKELEYIVAIDPNASAGSEEADNFAMCVIEMAGNGTEIGTVVHAYATAKSEFQKRTQYLEYLLLNFNVKLIVVDNAGGPNFIEQFRALHPNFGKKLEVVDIDFSSDEELARTRYLYNPTSGAMVLSCVFNARGFIRESNENLQADLQHRRILFGSKITYDHNFINYNLNLDLKVNIDDLEFNSSDYKNLTPEGKKQEFIDTIEEKVEETKRELLFIKLSTDAVGNQKYDLPKEMKINSGKDRARRDSYTALLLANWGRRAYLKLQDETVDYSDIYVGGWV